MRWNNNPAEATLGFPIYDPGMYRVKVKEVKPFENKLKEGQQEGEQSGGVRVICSLVGGDTDGKPYVANLYQHTEGARNFSKQFLVAAFGYPTNSEGEAQFNEESQNYDWGIDPDNNTLGSGWQKLVGREVNAELGIGTDQKGNPQQTAKYLPI